MRLKPGDGGRVRVVPKQSSCQVPKWPSRVAHGCWKAQAVLPLAQGLPLLRKCPRRAALFGEAR